MKNPRRILVRAPNWIGDQIMAYPFFYFLRKAYPQAHILSVCVDWVGDLQFRSCIDDVFELPRPDQPDLWSKFKNIDFAARLLKKRGPWDLGISLPNSVSAAWLIWRAGSRVRRGYQVEGRGLLLNSGVKWDSSAHRHRAQAYLDLLPESARPDCTATEFWGVPPEDEIDPGTQGVLLTFDAAQEWPRAKPLSRFPGTYYVIAPGAQADSRRWPLENWIELAREIKQSTGWSGLVVGGTKEIQLAERLCADSALGLQDYTARGSAASLSEIFRGARFTVCNESGLAHVAALCGSPVQIVCGAADPRRTRPLGPGRVQIKINPVDCWPCERNICVQTAGRTIQCLRGISASELWGEIKIGFQL